MRFHRHEVPGPRQQVRLPGAQQVRVVGAQLVELPHQPALQVVKINAVAKRVIADWRPAQTLQFSHDAAIFCLQEVRACRRSGVVGKVHEIHVELGEIALHHKAEIAR